MMKFGKAALLAAVVCSALGVVAVPAIAEPEEVTVTASLAGRTGKVVIAHGNVELQDGNVVVRDAAGKIVRILAGFYKIDDLRFSIEADVQGNTVVLTPNADATQAAFEAPSATQPGTEQAERARVAKTVADGGAIGAIAGGIPGAATGCFLAAGPGAIAGGVLGFIAGGITAALLSPVLLHDVPAIDPVLTTTVETMGVESGALSGTISGCVLAGAIIGATTAVAGALAGAAVGAVVAAFTTKQP
ncbi:hypothetical protein [Nocardia crassostreae]|uniref:hypothetical protein n=1 Tax=Nocardia crassostreae TaxID=53428 RepID=UPI000831582C|nr:hypothetical protein [Nocardia crassostreae]